MSNSKVATRYAASFLSFSLEKNVFDRSLTDLNMVYKNLQQNKDLKVMLYSPVVKQESKLSVIEKIYKNNISDDTLNFLKFVIKKGRENFIIEILSKYLELADKHLGIVSVEIRTAFDFNQEQKELLQKKLEEILNKKVRANYTIDSTIIGGFVAKSGDTVFDASIKHQLSLLKKLFFEEGSLLN